MKDTENQVLIFIVLYSDFGIKSNRVQNFNSIAAKKRPYCAYHDLLIQIQSLLTTYVVEWGSMVGDGESGSSRPVAVAISKPPSKQTY